MVLPIPINLFFIIVYALVGNYTTCNTTSYYMPIINHMIAYVIDFDKYRLGGTYLGCNHL